MLSAYIPRSGDNTVSVVDTVNNVVAATISGFDEPEGAAVSPDGTLVYVTNPGSGTDTVSVIDTSTNTITHTISVGSNPSGVAFSPDGSTVYVANRNDGTVSVIDVATHAVTATVSLGGSPGPNGLTVSPNGSKVYVANFNNTVSVIKTADNSVSTISDLSFNEPNTVAFTPDSSTAYVCNYGTDTISVVDVSTASVTGTITVGNQPWGVVITQDGLTAYVTQTNDAVDTTVTKITLATGSTSSITVGKGARGIAITPDGAYVYVLNLVDGTASVIKTATGVVVATITVGSAPISYGFFIQSRSTIMTTPYTAPQGRLTLTSNTPVMTADSTLQTSVYYTPYQGDLLPIYNGTNMVTYEFSQLTMALNTSNQTSGNIYDLFAFLNSGVVTIGAGPAWSSTTSRGTGAGTTQLQQTNGLWTNANSITLKNGSTSYSSIPAGEATYLGSVYMTANGQTAMQFAPAAASGGSNNILGLYNAYNRVTFTSRSMDSNNWSYNSGTVRSADTSSSNRINWLDGLQQSTVRAEYAVLAVASAGGTTAETFIGLDSTTTPLPSLAGCAQSTASLTVTFVMYAVSDVSPQYGFHYVQALEASSSGSTSFYSNGGNTMNLKAVLEM